MTEKMIAPLPGDIPAAPTPWQIDPHNPAGVTDALGNSILDVFRERFTHDQDAALARELVDLVNRAAASSATYADAYEVGYRNALADAALSDPEPVEGPAEPDPRDPSTWVRYVDRDGDEWFEFAPGRVGCGSREYVGNWVQTLIDGGENPAHYSAYLDDARESCGLRRA